MPKSPRLPAAPPLAALASLAAVLAAGCAPGSAPIEYPAADLRPPDLLAAGPTSSREVLLRFDEPVAPVAGSFSAKPGSELGLRAEGESLVLAFGAPQAPGADYTLIGEVDDASGNRTRFLLRFVGWNDRAPRLRLSEVLPCKNTSKTKPHRDFVELEALEDGNLGGEELRWASSVKEATYRFPGAEVRKGDIVVLHLAPEGIPEERDETGPDFSASGGIDATATGRDFWCGELALADSSGAISLALRPGAPPMDGLFYADDGKTGALGEGRLAELVASIAASGAWSLAGSGAAWEDGVPWSGSTSRSLLRAAAGPGKSAWSLSASGGQSPGLASAAAPPAAAKAADRPTAAKAATAVKAATTLPSDEKPKVKRKSGKRRVKS